ncbi:glutamate receptor ionotropic, delta-2-like [Panulirus ornatus]|uniref:glutamate receptor ionotropic, delta-2-like n=1 Tax=Panulirus ornatus TaxID=150431 RepID=UPI003A868D4D
MVQEMKKRASASLPAFPSPQPFFCGWLGLHLLRCKEFNEEIAELWQWASGEPSPDLLVVGYTSWIVGMRNQRNVYTADTLDLLMEKHSVIVPLLEQEKARVSVRLAKKIHHPNPKGVTREAVGRLIRPEEVSKSSVPAQYKCTVAETESEADALRLSLGVVESVLATLSNASCHLVFFTDGSTSFHTIFRVSEARYRWGLGLFEVAVDDQDRNVKETHFSQIIREARKLRQLSWCMTVVVVSDDPAFLAAFAQSSLKGRLLVWSTRLLVVTRLPRQELWNLHILLSMNNALLLIMDDASRCRMYVHLPYSQQGTPPLQVASWTPHRGLVLTTHLPLFPDKFFRFLQKPTLVVAEDEYQPHAAVLVEGPSAARRVSFTGPMLKVLGLLADSINFTYTLVRPPDGAWGAKQADGSWTGMVGMVKRKEIDIGLGPFGVTAVRAEVVDYTRPIVVDYARILAGRGRPEVDPWGFLLPLTPLVWGIILTALLVVVLATLLLLPTFSYITTTNQSDKFLDIFFNYLRVLLQQDIKAQRDHWWERLMLASWMMMTLVLTRSYTGNLMSLLAVRHIPQPYQSLRHVLDDPSTAMIWEANTAYVQHFRDAESGIFREVANAGEEGRIIYQRSTSFPESVETLVRRGEHVLIVEDLTEKVFVAQDFSKTGQCDFYSSREMFLPLMFAMVGRKDSPLVPVISERIKSVTEAGLYHHWMKVAVPNSTSCVHPPIKITVNTSLSVTNLSGMFLVFLGGFIVSLLVLFLEQLFSRTSQFWNA